MTLKKTNFKTGAVRDARRFYYRFTPFVISRKRIYTYTLPSIFLESYRVARENTITASNV